MRRIAPLSPIHFVGFLLWLTIVLACGRSTMVCAAEVQSVPHANAESVLTLLRGRRFSDLDKQLTTKQSAYEADPTHEEGLDQALEPFEDTARDLEPLLTEWVAKFPRSYAARLARGTYYKSLGWNARGGKYAEETPGENLREMDRWFDKALTDIDLSLSLTAKPVLSYTRMISIGQARGWKERKRRWLVEANKVAPSNISAKLAYLVSLRPQWGGSIVEMTAFVEESSKYPIAPEGLRRLESYVWRAKGRLARHREDYRAAAQHYTKSIELYDRDGEMYIYRGWTYADLGQQENAMRDYNRGIELRPKDPHGYQRRAALLIKMGEDQRALGDLDHVLEFDANDAWAWGNRGYLYERRGRLDQAFADYQKSAQLGDTWAQNRLGECYWGGRGTVADRQQAIYWWKNAAQKGNPEAQRHLKDEALRQP